MWGEVASVEEGRRWRGRGERERRAAGRAWARMRQSAACFLYTASLWKGYDTCSLATVRSLPAYVERRDDGSVKRRSEGAKKTRETAMWSSIFARSSLTLSCALNSTHLEADEAHTSRVFNACNKSSQEHVVVRRESHMNSRSCMYGQEGQALVKGGERFLQDVTRVSCACGVRVCKNASL